MRLHVLKSDPIPFQQMWRGLKTSELRRDELHFNEGDALLLREYSRLSKSFTGRSIQASIIFITNDLEALKSGYVMLCLTIPKWWVFKVNGENRSIH